MKRSVRAGVAACEPWKNEMPPGRSKHSRSGTRSACLRQLVEELHMGKRRAVHPLNFRIFRFDDVVLVRCVRAAPMAQAEVARGQAQRIAGEDITGPRPGVAR